MKMFLKENKTIRLIVLMIILIVLLVIAGITISQLTGNELFNKIRIKKYAETQELLKYEIIDLNNTEASILVYINDENGIEYVETPDGNIINGNGKTQLAIDYKVDRDSEYSFKIKKKNSSLETRNISVTDEDIVSIINYATSNEYKDIKYSANIKNMNNKKIIFNVDGIEPIEEIKSGVSAGSLVMTNYDLIRNDIVDTEGKLSLSLVLKDNKNNVLAATQKEIDVSQSFSTDNPTITAESLTKAIESYNGLTGPITVQVKDETYPILIYNISDDMRISSGDLYLGTEEEVGAEDRYAQKMIVLKVNGDLTIENNVKLSSYGTQYGGPKGMFVYSTGKVLNNGEISMSARGAWAEGQNVYIWKNSEESYEYVPKIGAEGGAPTSGTLHRGNKGQDGINRQTGGGAAGYAHKATSGAGAKGTSYSGGSRRRCL